MTPPLAEESSTARATMVLSTVSRSRVELTAWLTSPSACSSSTDVQDADLDDPIGDLGVGARHTGIQHRGQRCETYDAPRLPNRHSDRGAPGKDQRTVGSHPDFGLGSTARTARRESITISGLSRRTPLGGGPLSPRLANRQPLGLRAP